MNVNNIGWKSFNPSNNVNPEDEIGLNHNLLLEHVTQQKRTIPLDGSNEIKVIIGLIDIVIPKAIELTDSQLKAGEVDQAYMVALTCAVQANGYSNRYFQIDGRDSEFNSIWSKMTSMVLKVSATSIAEVLTELKLLDEEVVNSSIDPEGKSILFRAISTARYSSAYWVSEKLNSASEWIEISDARGGDFRAGDPPDWVYSDIEGALIGALFTANPFAALGGGAVSSAWTALKKVL